MNSGRLKRFLSNLTLILVSLLATLVILEIALHFTPYRRLLLQSRYLRYYYQADAAKGYDIRPNVGKMRTSVDRSVDYDIWSNELGCFDEPYRGEQKVILLVGDSFTHMYAPFKDKWGTRLEKLLDYRVIKAGVSGYGTRQELLKAKEIIARLPRSPRLIIVGYFWAALDRDRAFPDMTVVNGFLVLASKYKDPTGHLLNLEALERPYSFWDKLTGNYPLGLRQLFDLFLQQHFILVNLINDAAARLIPPKFSYENPRDFLAFSREPWVAQVWINNEANLQAFQELAAAQGAKLLIVVIPTNTQVYPFLAGGRRRDLERPNRILDDFLQREQIRYLDLLPFFRKYADETPRKRLDSQKDLYWRFNSHFSIKGERLASLLVSREILEDNLVQVADRQGKLKEIEAQLKNFH